MNFLFFVISLILLVLVITFSLVLSFKLKITRKSLLIVITSFIFSFILFIATLENSDEELLDETALLEEQSDGSDVEEKDDKDVGSERKKISSKDDKISNEKDSEETTENEPEEDVEENDDSAMYELLIEKQVEEYDGTTINDINVNSNLEEGENHGYYTQVFLKWDVQNSAQTTRDMIKMYSSDLAASLNNYEELIELTVFWEIPYHVKGENIAKYTFGRNDDGMYFDDTWHAPALQ